MGRSPRWREGAGVTGVVRPCRAAWRSMRGSSCAASMPAPGSWPGANSAARIGPSMDQAGGDVRRGCIHRSGQRGHRWWQEGSHRGDETDPHRWHLGGPGDDCAALSDNKRACTSVDTTRAGSPLKRHPGDERSAEGGAGDGWEVKREIGEKVSYSRLESIFSLPLVQMEEWGKTGWLIFLMLTEKGGSDDSRS